MPVKELCLYMTSIPKNSPFGSLNTSNVIVFNLPSEEQYNYTAFNCHGNIVIGHK